MSDDRKEPQYRLVADQYVFFIGDEEPTKPANSISLCIDIENGTLLKHGDNQGVCNWHVQALAKKQGAGLTKWPENMVVLTGRFPLDELNKCLSIADYSKSFHEKLMRGEIEEVECEMESTFSEKPSQG